MHTLLDLLAAAVAANGDKTALSLRLDDGSTTTWSYRELDRRSRIAAWRLRALGLEPGDRLLTWSPSTPELPAAYFGAMRARLVLVPLDLRMSADAIEGIVRVSGARHLILGEGRDAPDPREAGLDRFPTTALGAITAEPDDTLPGGLGGPARRLGSARHRRRLRARLHLRHDRQSEGRHARPRQRGRVGRVVPPPDPADGASDRLAAAAVAPARAVGRAVLRALGRGGHPVRPEPQPAGHLRCACATTGSPRWSSSPRSSTCSGAPSSARSPSAAARPRFERLRGDRPAAADRLAAAPVRQRPQAAGRPLPAVPVGRGLPAAGAPAGLGGPRRHGPPGLRRDRDRDRQLHDARRPRPRARSAARRTASRCGSSRTARSSSAARRVFRGYWQNPTATAAAFTDDGWYRTGDIGHLDPAGRLILSGRKRDMIVLPNGFNVYPEDIENALRIAGIRDSVVLETEPGRIEAVVLGSAIGPARRRRGRCGRRERPRGGARPDRRRGQGRQRDARPEPAHRGLAAVARRGLPADPHLKIKRDADPRPGSPTRPRGRTSPDGSAQFGDRVARPERLEGGLDAGAPRDPARRPAATS